MKTIDTIVIHTSATPFGMDFHAKDIDRWHREQGYNQIGYNFVIDLDGTIEVGRPLTKNGAHCLGYNDHSIGICYIGGLDGFGKPFDTRTVAQKKAMHELVEKLMDEYPTIVEVIGHRDTYPDKDGDGVITEKDWLKFCPCFDVRSEFPMSYCFAKK